MPSANRDTTLPLPEPRLGALLHATPDLLVGDFLPCNTSSNFCPLKFLSSFQRNKLKTLFCRHWPAGGAVWRGNHSLKVNPAWPGDCWLLVAAVNLWSSFLVQLLACLRCARHGHILFAGNFVLEVWILTVQIFHYTKGDGCVAFIVFEIPIFFPQSKPSLSNWIWIDWYGFNGAR